MAKKVRTGGREERYSTLLEINNDPCNPKMYTVVESDSVRGKRVTLMDNNGTIYNERKYGVNSR